MKILKKLAKLLKPRMASNIDQFADLELSKEDCEQIFEDPIDATQALSSPQNGSTQSTKVAISGIPHHANFNDVEPLLKQFGNVEECDAVASKDPKTQTVHITFETFEQAQR